MSEEFISRQAVLDELEKWDWQDLYLPIHFKQILDDVKSADVRENIHARWESDGHGHIICTACKEANVSTWKSRFCPMCGARMDEVKHDE